MDPESAVFVSFDGAVRERAEYQRPTALGAIARMDGAAAGGRSAMSGAPPIEGRPPPYPGPCIARGGGYSYAAASFGGGSTIVDMTALDRVLRFLPDAGLIEVEAGVTLGQLLDVTAPRGLWLPVQPGYPAITVGGCIAANVHGKSPEREGTFTRSIVDLSLYHPHHGTLRLTPDEHPALFELTCGGLGLTGIILSATLRLERLAGSVVRLRRVPVGSLHEGLAGLRASAGSEFAYTWHDGTPRPGRFARGFLFHATIPPGQPPAAPVTPRYRQITAAARGRLPWSLWTGRTTGLLTSGFRWLQTLTPSETTLPLFDALFPLARRPEYLESFGRPGIAEFQALMPHATIDAFLAAVEQRVVAARAPLTLISLRLFRGRQRLLRFEADGVSVGLTLARTPAGVRFLAVLDELLAEAGGIPNVIKDSRLPRAVVQGCYPEYEAFRARLHAHDPARVFRSELSARLGL